MAGTIGGLVTLNKIVIPFIEKSIWLHPHEFIRRLTRSS
jgi:hypothetical protein